MRAVIFGTGFAPFLAAVPLAHARARGIERSRELHAWASWPPATGPDLRPMQGWPHELGRPIFPVIATA